MSQREEKIEEIPSELGPQLVDILYTNTQLNYDVCAQNLIQVFRHLNQKLPQLEHISTHLIETIKVRSSLCLSNLLMFLLIEKGFNWKSRLESGFALSG